MPREQYESRWKDYYEILQVHPKAEPEVISAAYRRLAQMYHPDSRRSDASASAKMAEINEAKEVLSDPPRRARYDQVYQIRQSGFGAESNEEASQQDASDSDDYNDNEWYADSESSRSSAYSGAYSQDAQAYGSPYEYESERVPILSFSFLRLLLDRLMEKLCPSPDESQRITPWLSWSWQRLFLMGSIPLAFFIFIVAVAQAAWPGIVFALVLGGGAVYAGLTTEWMRATNHAPVQARFAGGTCITISSISYALGLAFAVFAIVITVLILIFMAAALRAMLAEAFNKYLR